MDLHVSFGDEMVSLLFAVGFRWLCSGGLEVFSRPRVRLWLLLWLQTLLKVEAQCSKSWKPKPQLEAGAQAQVWKRPLILALRFYHSSMDCSCLGLFRPLSYCLQLSHVQGINPQHPQQVLWCSVLLPWCPLLLLRCPLLLLRCPLLLLRCPLQSSDTNLHFPYSVPLTRQKPWPFFQKRRSSFPIFGTSVSNSDFHYTQKGA